MQLYARMSPRDPNEAHRPSTPLELFFDLTFAVAIAQATSGLDEGLAGGHASRALVVFPLVFFAIWWAWMNFTWFASAYDTDDVAYRIAVLVQMTGVLILAVGIPRAFHNQDFGVMVVGYVLMRIAMVALWLRAAASDSGGRRCARRYAVGIAVVQIGWVAWSRLSSDIALPVFGVLVACELGVPLWAEAAGRTAWHPSHIAERYGLFTIIVLGETLLAATVGVRAALSNRATFGNLATVVIGGLLAVFSMWWLYFDMPSDEIVTQVRKTFTERLTGAFVWGYGHFVVFASVAAVGAGLAVEIDQITHSSKLTNLESGFAVTVPVVLYLLVIWGLHAPYKSPSRLRTFAVPLAAMFILASSVSHQATLATGVLLALLVAVSVATSAPRAAASAT
jgi:low temperature requirement protein LtrA